MRKLLALALLFAPLAAHAITQEELVKRTSEMFDAAATGDQTSWKRNVADDVLYFTEKGVAMDKKALVNDVQPLPPGYTGVIKLVNIKSNIMPTIAILSYDSNETETVFGQELHARYHEIDTWLLRNGEWQIVAGQVLRYYEDPAIGTLDPARLNDYLGTYQLAPGQTLTVTRQGNKLFAQHSSGKPSELLAESPDLFFRPGVEGRRLFHRNANGKVDSLIDRRNNEDILYKKIS